MTWAGNGGSRCPLALIVVVTMLVFRVTVQRKAEPAHETREAEGDADPSHDQTR